MKKRYISLLLILTAVAILAFVYLRPEEENNVIQPHELAILERFGFRFRLVVRGEEQTVVYSELLRYIIPSFPRFNPELNEVVVVRALAEAKELPDNVIAAFPHMPLTTRSVLSALNNIITGPIPIWQGRPERLAIDLQTIGLTYPITEDDIFDNWEKVFQLWNSITFNERDRIIALGRNRLGYFYRDLSVTPIKLDEEVEITEAHRNMVEKFNYALAMQFWFVIRIDGQMTLSEAEVRKRIDPNSPNFDPFFTDIYLEIRDWGIYRIPDNVILAFPMLGSHLQGFITRFREAIGRQSHELIVDGVPLRDVVSLEEFGLEYPLVWGDFVDNWQKVYAVWNALHPSEQEVIRDVSYLVERYNARR